MMTSRMARGLAAMGIMSLMGCQVTLGELQARNPGAKTLKVHCHPWQIPENVKIFAARASGDGLTTDETPDKLWEDAEHAGVFIEVNASAPRENAKIMASDYGLVCREHLAIRSTPLEALREKKPCLMQANAVRTPQYMGDTNSQPCSPGAGDSANGATGSKPASLPRIGVCVRPEGISSNEWYGGPGIKADVKTRAEHEAQVEKATVVFYVDASAPPESIWHFGPNIKARCPGKAPIPYDQWVAKHSGTGTQQSRSTNAGTSSPPPPPPTRATTPKTGSSPPSQYSSPNGQGPPLSTFEKIANNLAVGGALAQGDTSGNLKDRNGHRNGIPGGQDAAAFSFPALQAGYGLLQLLTSINLSPKSFIDDIVVFGKRGQRTVIKEADEKMMKVADELIQKHGRYEMAKGLEEMQTIMPYAMGEKFTAELGGKFQAHKIFEKRAFKHFKMEGIDKAPCVIPTDKKHEAISAELARRWKGKEETMTREELRKIYREVYKDFPHWLEAIEPYFH